MVTGWVRTKFYVSKGNAPSKAPIRLTSIPSRAAYGAFQPQDSRLILANEVTPVRKFLIAGRGHVDEGKGMKVSREVEDRWG